jgi:hypothetical protein
MCRDSDGLWPSLRRHGFTSMQVHVGFMVNKFALGQAFLPVLQYPLSVSFHQCSILIQSSTTDVVQCFSPNTSVSPVSIIPPMLHTHLSTYHQRCIIFFSQYFSFPCQCHSTNVPHPFIHLLVTLYNVFLAVFQFPLSLSFHQCSTLIFIYMLMLTDGKKKNSLPL